MPKATIVLKDDPDGSLDITIDFGDLGVRDESFAHQAAARMLLLFQVWIAENSESEVK